MTHINLFKTGVKPTWEDAKNKHGGDFRIEVSQRDPALLQQVFEKIVFGFVTGSIPSVEKNITGLCIVCKSKWNQFTLFRVEIWVEDGNQNSEQNTQLSKYLDEQIIKEILTVPDGKEVSIKWNQHSH